MPANSNPLRSISVARTLFYFLLLVSSDSQLYGQSIPNNTTATQPRKAIAALDPTISIFLVHKQLNVFAYMQFCSLTPGDLLKRTTMFADPFGYVKAEVFTSKEGDCAVGQIVSVAVADLQEMLESEKTAQEVRRGLHILLGLPDATLPVWGTANELDYTWPSIDNTKPARTGTKANERVKNSDNSSAVPVPTKPAQILLEPLTGLDDYYPALFPGAPIFPWTRWTRRNPGRSLSIDGNIVASDEITSAGEGFQLRGDSTLTGTLSDGLHHLREGATRIQAILAVDEFVWKENNNLLKFKPYNRNYAVVIAIEDYGDTSGLERLPGAMKQCNEVASTLEDQRFVVKRFCGKDANRQNIEDYLYGDLSRNLGKDDGVLIYFGGHGYTSRTQFGEDLGFLVTYGATKDSIIENSIPMSRIQTEYVRTIPAKHVLFVLDACFSGLAVRESASPSAEQLSRYRSYLEIKTLSSTTARAILSAGSGKEPGLNANGGGIFTHAFLDGIKGAADTNKDGVVTQQELYAYIRNRVIYEANNFGYRQVPQYSPLTRFGSGEFLFIPATPHNRF